VRLNGFPSGSRVAVFDNDGQYSIFITTAGAIRCKGFTAGTLLLDQWTHIACTFDTVNQHLRIYQAGQQVADEAWTASLGTSNTNPMNIGASSPSGDNFNGDMEGFRIWSKIRDGDELCWAAQR